MMLGKGSFGKVYRGYDHTTNNWVAIKQLQLDLLEKYGEEIKESILSEINVMKKFTRQIKVEPC
jgi:serine/threonine protein kinase